MSETPLAGWPHAESPFHPGERATQERLGVRDQIEARARVAIRGFLPEQHRAFYPQLPFVLIGSVDAEGQPWASVLAGEPGFVTSPDPLHLQIRARALFADPLRDTLAAQAPIGLLGIQPHTRRRNRMNGFVTELTADAFSLRVNQSYGNCPKYIQARQPIYTAAASADRQTRPVRRAATLDAAMRGLVGTADTFYIASAIDERHTDQTRQRGVDIAHRGGKPGFVRVDDERTLTMPDFTGNYFFNTVGNIALNPHTGLLFIDFESGDLLYLAVTAEIIWDGVQVQAFEGAQRLLRFHVKQALCVERSLPLQWGPAALSPALEKTGSWETAAPQRTPDSAQD